MAMPKMYFQTYDHKGRQIVHYYVAIWVMKTNTPLLNDSLENRG